MFPTSGFFRSQNCPYYLSGLCERPYCHFRHVKQEERSPALHPLHSSSKHVRRVSESGQSGPSSSVAVSAAAPRPARQASESEASDAGGGSGDYTPTPLSVLRRSEDKKRPATVEPTVQSADPSSYEPTPVTATSTSQPTTTTATVSPQPTARRRPLQLPPPKSSSDNAAASFAVVPATSSTSRSPAGEYDPLEDGAGPSCKRGRRLSPELELREAAPILTDYEPTPIGTGGGNDGSDDLEYDYGGGGDDGDDDEYCPTAGTAQPPASLLPPPLVAATAPPATDAATTSGSGEGSGIQQVFLDLFGEEPDDLDHTAAALATASAMGPTKASDVAASSVPPRVGALSARRILSPAEQLARRNQLAAANPTGLLSQGKVRTAVSSSMAAAAPPTTPLAGSVANKIPEVVRQRYLDRLAEECRLSGGAAAASDKAAKRALQLELECYERSTNRNVYLNAVILAIKRVRSAADQSQQQQQQRKQTPENAGQLSDKRLHKHLMQYALTETQLAENKFPPHMPQLPYAPPSNLLERLCVRCGAAFLLQLPEMSVPPGQCCYHYGRAYSRRVPGAGVQQVYSCCGGDPQAKGCSLGARHVHDYNVYSDTEGFRPTVEPDKRNVHKKQRLAVYALDCEMVYTEAGKELARVTMIDRSLAVVYDRLVRPGAPIVDCNTRFSGLKEEQLTAAEHRLADVQEELLRMVYSTCILIGHSLESDLQVLKLRHTTVVDTSIVFPHRQGLPKKRALRNLASEILNKIIQAGGDAGHDSSEDARACMELMLYKVTEDLRKGKSPH